MATTFYVFMAIRSYGNTASPFYENLWKDHLCAILSPRHPLALQSEISIEAMAGELMILGHRNFGCGARADMDRFIGAAGARSRVEDAANLNVLRSLVGAEPRGL